MKQKRKDILKDLLGEYADDSLDDDYVQPSDSSDYITPDRETEMEASESYNITPEQEPLMAQNTQTQEEVYQENTPSFEEPQYEQPQYEETPKFDEPKKEDDSLNIFDDSGDDGLNIEEIMKKKAERKANAPTKSKSGSNSAAEIIEDGAVPLYKVTRPEFSEKEKELLDEIRDKLVESAVARGEELNVDGDAFLNEIKEFLRVKGIRNVDKFVLLIYLHF